MINSGGNLFFKSRSIISFLISSSRFSKPNDLAKEALKDVISPIEQIKITPEYIMDVVCDHFNISPDDVCSKKRNAEIVLPRQIIMYLCRQYTDAAQKKIALLCGKTDHTTVIHAENKIKNEIEENDSIRNTIETLVKKINPN